MMGRPGVRRLGILRVERNGVVQPEGVEIKAGEEVTGLRLTIAEFNGAIRGLVKWDDDETPALNDTSVSYIRIDDNGMKPELMGVGSQQWDSRGNFLIEGLAPGTYEVRVHVQVAGLPNLISSKQQVTVTNNSVTEVTLIVPRKPGPE